VDDLGELIALAGRAKRNMATRRLKSVMRARTWRGTGFDNGQGTHPCGTSSPMPLVGLPASPLSSFSLQPSTSDPDTTDGNGSLGLGEPCEPCDLLDALAARLRGELRGQQTGLMICLQTMCLAIVYHHVVIMRWTVVGDELVCTPIGWRRRTFTAASLEEARTIAIRLVFEFVRQFHPT
jgi:hypothetical protein